MAVSRREFFGATAVAGLAGLVRLEGQPAPSARKIFRHGVASGDPLSDRVILWTRVTAPEGATPEVQWEIAADNGFKRVVARGAAETAWERDFTVKIDASGLRPATTYYYRFQALGERSPIGRTRTLPASGTGHLRLALVSCSNFPFGYFNVYDRIAQRADLDAVLHLGDYLYEYANATYGDGTKLGRISDPNREVVSIADYRQRHAQYKSDPDLQEAHRQHPWITTWDDHEVANNTWRAGAENHQPDRGEGGFSARRDAAIQAYFEWMPIREDRATRQPRIYRTFSIGDLADLIMLDTRVIDRDEQAGRRDDLAIVDDPARSVLGRTQEEWFYQELRESKRAGIRWQLVGQQIPFAPLSLPGAATLSTDTWEGYRPARKRFVDAITGLRLANTVVLTGDVHSSWGYDIAANPFDGYDASTGRGTLGVEIVAPSVTSPSGFGNTPEDVIKRADKYRAERPHLRYVDGALHGYVVLDVTRERLQADWFYVPTVTERSTVETFGKGLVSAAGQPHLVDAATPASRGAGAGVRDPA
jgi:alkaline phosphatase D